MALKDTGVELELITYRDVYLVIENNMRDGIAAMSHQYASANNPLVDGYGGRDREFRSRSAKADAKVRYIIALEHLTVSRGMLCLFAESMGPSRSW